MIENLPVMLNKKVKDIDCPKFIDCINYLTNKGTFASDNTISLNSGINFMQDPKFNKSLEEHPNKKSLEIVWSLHTACWVAQRCLQIAGDFVECGIKDGIISTMIASYLDFNKIDKNFYIYDNFSHTSEQHNLNYYTNINLIHGELPYCLQNAKYKKISFLHINVESFETARIILTILFEYLTTNAIVLIENFGLKYYDIHKVASEPLLVNNNIKTLELPSGQGMFII